MTDLDFSTKISKASEYISSQLSEIPDTCLVLGSGLGPLTERAEVLASVPYADIPYFPKTTVQGHEGVLLLAVLSGRKTLIMKGRFHSMKGTPRRKQPSMSALWLNLA